MPPQAAQFTISNDRIPLAVYREIAAHLQQIAGIAVADLAPPKREFDYLQSQLGGLKITGADRLLEIDRLRLDRILDYYANRYDRWDFDR